VKQAAAEGVGRMGFKPGIPYLRAGMNQNCDPGLTGVTKEALENSMKCEDYRRICRDALAKMK
jgi:hypothetical protein